MDLPTFLTSLGTGFLGGLLGFTFFPFVRRHMIYDNMEILLSKKEDGHGNLRIYNASELPIKNAWAYISIEIDPSDVITTLQHLNVKKITKGAKSEEKIVEIIAFNAGGPESKIEDDRLCWATTYPTWNPPYVDIFSGESQNLCIVKVFSLEGKEYLEIPSERGYTTDELNDYSSGEAKVSRVFLDINKSYNATISIVSETTLKKTQQIVINANPRQKTMHLLGLR